ncbi:TPA: hypothetical protein DDZ75_03795, partial [Patescibacteria group bacterium]|nr:hypothetical protein [Patescibacteria group bacterium]
MFFYRYHKNYFLLYLLLNYNIDTGIVSLTTSVLLVKIEFVFEILFIIKIKYLITNLTMVVWRFLINSLE